MESISHHITPLVIAGLRGGHTDTQTDTYTSRTRNQACTSLLLACTWFNNNFMKKSKKTSQEGVAYSIP